MASVEDHGNSYMKFHSDEDSKSMLVEGAEARSWAKIRNWFHPISSNVPCGTEKWVSWDAAVPAGAQRGYGEDPKT